MCLFSGCSSTLSKGYELYFSNNTDGLTLYEDGSIYQIDPNAYGHAMCFGEGETLLYYTGRDNAGEYQLFDLETQETSVLDISHCISKPELLSAINVDKELFPIWIVLRENATTLFFASFTRNFNFRIFAVNYADGTVKYTPEIANDSYTSEISFAVNEDNETVLFSENNGENSSIYSYNFSTKEKVLYVEGGENPQSSCDGQYLFYFMDDAGIVENFETREKFVVESDWGHRRQVSFSKSGEYLVSTVYSTNTWTFFQKEYTHIRKIDYTNNEIRMIKKLDKAYISEILLRD